jgi:hypothetical protein
MNRNNKHVILILSLIFCGTPKTTQAEPLLSKTDFAYIAGAIGIWSIIDGIKIFKKPNASPFYRKHFDDALRAYGVKNPEAIALKNDSSMDSSCLGEATLFGVRLNEKALNNDSVHDRIHTCYHEAAHIAKKHKIKAYASLIAAYCISAMGINSSNTKIMIGSSLCYLAILAKIVYDGIFLPWDKRPYEIEAEAMANELYRKHPRKNIVLKNNKIYILDQQRSVRSKKKKSVVKTNHISSSKRSRNAATC